MATFSKLIDWLKDAMSPLRQSLQLARLPEQSPLRNIPVMIGLAHGRLFGREHISLAFSSKYAYKFRYLHRGLTRLAATGAIHYTFLGYDSSLGRKTAVIHYNAPNTRPITGVIDGSASSSQLGQSDIDFDRVFGSKLRVLLKMQPGLKNAPSNSSSHTGNETPQIDDLYDIVLDGAYWPINTLFLNEKWVTSHRRWVAESVNDVMAIYSLQPVDMGDQGENAPANQGERFRFSLQAERLETLGFRLRLGIRLVYGLACAEIPSHVHPYLIDQFLPYEDYLEALCSSRLLFCPKSNYVNFGQRTYRLVENLALGCVCLSSPVRLHFDFEPGVHYVAIAEDFGDLEEVLTHYLNTPGELERIRCNVASLYKAHLSPIAIARYYARMLRALAFGEA